MSGGKKIQEYFAKLRQSEDEGMSQTESEAGDQSQNKWIAYYVTMCVHAVQTPHQPMNLDRKHFYLTKLYKYNEVSFTFKVVLHPYVLPTT